PGRGGRTSILDPPPEVVLQLPDLVSGPTDDLGSFSIMSVHLDQQIHQLTANAQHPSGPGQYLLLLHLDCQSGRVAGRQHALSGNTHVLLKLLHRHRLSCAFCLHPDSPRIRRAATAEATFSASASMSSSGAAVFGGRPRLGLSASGSVGSAAARGGASGGS